MCEITVTIKPNEDMTFAYLQRLTDLLEEHIMYISSRELTYSSQVQLKGTLRLSPPEEDEVVDSEAH